MEIFKQYKQREDGLKEPDKTKLSRKFKVWCLEFARYSRPQ